MKRLSIDKAELEMGVVMFVFNVTVIVAVPSMIAFQKFVGFCNWLGPKLP